MSSTALALTTSSDPPSSDPPPSSLEQLQSINDSLPYIDPPLPPQYTTAAQSLLTSSLPPSYLTTPHPSLPPLSTPSIPPSLQPLLDRLTSSNPPPPPTSINLTRYDPTTTPPPPPHLLQLSHTHLTTRSTNLTLLSSFGKNAWLVHNDQLEGLLRDVETELAREKELCEEVNKERKKVQVEAQTEVERLARKWREGVGRVLETEVAAEEVRREVVSVRREMAERMVRGKGKGKEQ